MAFAFSRQAGLPARPVCPAAYSAYHFTIRGEATPQRLWRFLRCGSGAEGSGDRGISRRSTHFAKVNRLALPRVHFAKRRAQVLQERGLCLLLQLGEEFLIVYELGPP